MHLKIYGLLLRLLQLLISLFYNKKKTHIIIGSSAGTNVNGNGKALFLHMINNATSTKGYFITRNKSLYKEYKNKYPNHFLYAYTFQALFIFLSAKAYVITHGSYDVFPFKCRKMGKPVINVWHGFPMKKLGNDSLFLTERQKQNFIGNYEGVVALSEADKYIMSRSLHTKPENTWVTGYPRNDFLFYKNDDVLNQTPYIKGKKVILYAPTFRDFETTKIFPFKDFDKRKLEAFLAANNAILLFRIHKNELKQHNLAENDVIKICDGNVIQEVNELLPFINILITDYSSIYVDYLLINKPVIFIPYDLEKFAETRGFNFDYNQVTAGSKPKTFSGFLSAIEDNLINPSLDAKKRLAMRSKFHKFYDNGSSKRVYEKIQEILIEPY